MLARFSPIGQLTYIEKLEDFCQILVDLSRLATNCSVGALFEAIGFAGLAGVAGFGVQAIDGENRLVAAAFGGSVMVAEIGEVMIAGCAEIGAKAALRRLDFGKVTAFEQVGQETLDGVFSLVIGQAAATDEGVEWEPVVSAEGFESLAGFRVRRAGCACQARPVGGGEARSREGGTGRVWRAALRLFCDRAAPT
jgi:hypothetical protein